MARPFLTTSGMELIKARDLPALNLLGNGLDISQINAVGVTGQIIADIGASGLRWQHITAINLAPSFKSGSGVVPLASLTSLTTNDILKWNGSAWVNTPDSTGSVTSVALTAPSELTVGGSPVTSTGTLALSWANQTTNKFFASPNGSTGTPTFRAITVADLANDLVTYAKIQNMATNKLLGRSTASSGDIEEISIGTGLSLSAGTLSSTVTAGIASINADTTSAQLIVGSGGVSVATVGGTTTIQQTALSGTDVYILIPGGWQPTTTTMSVGANNRVQVMKIYVRANITISKVIYNLNNTQAAQFTAVGIYDSAGTTKVIDTGAQNAATGLHAVTLAAPVMLAPGFYWFAWTASTTGTLFHATDTANAFTSVLNSSTTQLGYGANSSASGVLPSSLGSITADAIGVAVAKLQG